MVEELEPKYVWVMEGEGCELCAALDGTVYNKLEDIPNPPHPNCQCGIEEVDLSICDCIKFLYDIETLIGNGENLKVDAVNEADKIEQLLSKYESMIARDLVEIILSPEGLKEIVDSLISVLEIFISNLEELKETNNGSYDKFYHAKANCEASQRSELETKIAKAYSDIKEYLDILISVKFRRKSLESAARACAADQKANKEGRDLGRKYPKSEPREILKHLLPILFK